MRLPIKFKITILVTLVSAVILSVVFIHLKEHFTQNIYRRIRERLSREILLVGGYIDQQSNQVNLLYAYDKMADKVSQFLGLRVTFIDEQGIVLGDSEVLINDLNKMDNHLFRPEVQEALRKGLGESRRFSTTIQTDMLYMAYFFDNPENNIIVRLAIPLSEIDLISQQLNKTLVWAVFSAFLLASLIGFLFSIVIARPVRKVADIALSISRGDYSRRINISSNDELEELGDAINHMSEQIKERIDEIISNKSRFEAILLSMLDGVMVIDQNGKIILMNSALKKILRVEEDPLDKNPLEVIRNIEIQDIADLVIRSQKGIESRELKILPPVSKTLLVHAAPVIRQDIHDGAVVVFHDITELRRLENIRRDFVANVSHELRTPITNIKGFAETLLDGALDDGEHARDFMKIIHEDANRLAQLVEDLLNLSKIESGKAEIESTPISVRDVINRVVKGMREQAKHQQVKIKVLLPKIIPNIMGDEGGIGQVLINLIENAVKYNKKNGTVTVKVSVLPEQGVLQISVVDEGIGIPEKDLLRVFERFYRVDKARSRKLGGTGLGLSIAKHIVQIHGGDIHVESQLDHGSTFTFTLKLAT
ncbi:MAG: cell wall metabolism sensor histidine kinase WalK [Candidatus Omnitrophica bacterium]|nr:cell wall metabolism sensor histidine kinase WalK [Candidatus Omnitrophota bacterium]